MLRTCRHNCVQLHAGTLVAGRCHGDMILATVVNKNYKSPRIEPHGLDLDAAQLSVGISSFFSKPPGIRSAGLPPSTAVSL